MLSEVQCCFPAWKERQTEREQLVVVIVCTERGTEGVTGR